MREYDVINRGQVFTPESIVQRMLDLRQNHGSVLEPSCGDGAFLHAIPEAMGIEIDKTISPYQRVWLGDFFAYPTSESFDTIIGNPPYVRYNDILDSTKALLPMDLFDRRSNLYLFFIAKCMRHLKHGGELIFITPRDFIKATSAGKLNDLLYASGSITHFEELGDKAIFAGYSPNCAIWRWQKGLTNRQVTSGQGLFNCRDGQIWFGDESSGSLGDFFDVKVGAVSGADDIFANDERGNVNMVCSRTRVTGETKRMLYNKQDKSLHRHKSRLMQRRIRKFDESNWWEWGRGYHNTNRQRLYVNCKTRHARPFFTHEGQAYDGSVLALFPKRADCDVALMADKLNGVDWDRLGFVCDGRLIFSQKGLETAPIDMYG